MHTFSPKKKKKIFVPKVHSIVNHIQKPLICMMSRRERMGALYPKKYKCTGVLLTCNKDRCLPISIASAASENNWFSNTQSYDL